MIELSGYRITERLRAGITFSTYRAVRLEDGASVIIKVNDAAQCSPQAQQRKWRNRLGVAQ